MPITLDYCIGMWEYKYECKTPKDGHKWIAMGHTKNQFDDALVFLNAYEEYYGCDGHRCYVDINNERVYEPIFRKNFKEKAIIVPIEEVKEEPKIVGKPKPKAYSYDADLFGNLI